MGEVVLYLVSSTDGSTLARNTPAGCDLCPSVSHTGITCVDNCPVFQSRRKTVAAVTQMGRVFMCCGDTDALNSSRVLRSRFDGFVAGFALLDETVRGIRIDADRRMTRFVHNITAINAHCIQEIFDLVPQDVLTGHIDDQLDIIGGILSKNKVVASKTVLRLVKNNLAMKSEFAAFRAITESAPLVFRRHVLRKVVLNTLHTFFADFTDKDVRVDVLPSNIVTLLDYETFSVAIFHIVENASKYGPSGNSVGFSVGFS